MTTTNNFFQPIPLIIEFKDIDGIIHSKDINTVDYFTLTTRTIIDNEAHGLMLFNPQHQKHFIPLSKYKQTATEMYDEFRVKFNKLKMVNGGVVELYV